MTLTSEISFLGISTDSGEYTEYWVNSNYWAGPFSNADIVVLGLGFFGDQRDIDGLEIWFNASLNLDLFRLTMTFKEILIQIVVTHMASSAVQFVGKVADVWGDVVVVDIEVVTIEEVGTSGHVSASFELFVSFLHFLHAYLGHWAFLQVSLTFFALVSFALNKRMYAIKYCY